MNTFRYAASALIALEAISNLSGCNIPPPPPDEPLLDPVINSAEYSTDTYTWFQDPDLFKKIEAINKATNDAFGQVARINFAFDGPKTTGLAPGTPDGQWPVLDTNDPLHDQSGAGEKFYVTYLQDHRNTTYAFGVYWVAGPPSSFDICGNQRKIMGATPDATLFEDNNVTPDVKSRGTFVFAGWIHGVTQCQWYFNAHWPAINLYIRVHTHEMGHQRADLSHADERGAFHTGPIPQIDASNQSGYEVMYSNALSNDLRKTVPIFDQHYEPATESTPCIHLTCQDNLACWRSIKN